MISMIMLFIRKRIFNIIKSKIFWMGILVSVGVLFVLISSLSFSKKVHLISKVNAVASAAESTLNTATEFYNDALEPEGLNIDISFGKDVEEDEDYTWTVELIEDSQTNGPNGPNGPLSDSYDDLKDRVEQIEGSSVLHQVHNSITKITSESQYPWFQYWLVIGKNMKEANGFGGSWVQHIGVDRKGIQDPDFDINTWGAKDITNFSDISTYYNNKSYIGPFQTSPDYYFGAKTGRISGDINFWIDKVESSSGGIDGNGDGKSDPFNYLDALKAMEKHSNVKLGETERYMSFLSEEYKDDMIGMSIATRYVGISNDKGTKRFGSENGPWTGYTHHEHLNPHIALMREAAEEYHNNGPYFQEFSNYLSNSKTINGTEAQRLMNNFFNSVPGWVATGNSKNGGSLTYTFSDGKTMKFTGQEMHYTFLVYWGGKVAEQEIPKLLEQ